MDKQSKIQGQTMIQDISPAHLNNHYDPTKTADENSIILFSDLDGMELCSNPQRVNYYVNTLQTEKSSGFANEQGFSISRVIVFVRHSLLVS